MSSHHGENFFAEIYRQFLEARSHVQLRITHVHGAVIEGVFNEMLVGRHLGCRKKQGWVGWFGEIVIQHPNVWMISVFIMVERGNEDKFHIGL